ncbi:iron-containing alcohol dehydrogenase [Clostridium felsineum]|uniref:NADH-dependent butanol dehydrogenase A n=1 Tax=Clostridium felsineum TaxID=36839 RepID=A0A1S8L0I5_9CLOT|nr:iron-containing alcohol dehydrogenase [Clostridium felsineum]URZ01560.1 NADH-dependent butanol dehydrogenase A [Clostridium felsineum]URZ05594.1 NADH-dependent butanol dehydrogenase A [Clostridium felsineum]URZ10633.1 NADH-dependent butanol dehydrogenase A [Clostridium felsineum]
MNNFIFNAYTEMLFGKGQIERLPEVLKRYGKSVLLTYGGGSIKRNGIYNKVKELLKDFNVVELSGIEPNPRIETVRHGVELSRENKVDVILAVGGGSTIDCSKVIAAAHYYEKDAWDIVTTPSKIDKVLPIVTVLTMAATGSEMNKNAVISNMKTKEKLGTASTKMIPKASFLDPEYTYSVPKIQTAAGCADIMSHIFEAYFNKTKDAFVQDRFAEGLLETCIKYCPIALKEPENYEARANIMWASSMALNGLLGSGKGGAWTCHPIEHELSAFYDITHGIGLAILTPRWMRYILSEKTVNKFVDYGINVWNLKLEEDKFELARKAIDKTEEFFKMCGIPMTLSELQIDNTNFEEMARAAVIHGNLNEAYVALNKDDVYKILEMCI